jgi:hypothetical protein
MPLQSAVIRKAGLQWEFGGGIIGKLPTLFELRRQFMHSLYILSSECPTWIEPQTVGAELIIYTLRGVHHLQSRK